MIKPAFLYKEQIEKMYANIWFEDKYKFYNYTPYWQNLNINDKTTDWHEFVSLNEKGEIIGLFSYYVYRDVSAARSFGAINFTDDMVTFGRDLLQVIDEIFTKFNFNKLNFGVVIGNPIEKTYDRLCTKYGGRILCVEKDETRLQDNKLYDVKRYEIMRSEYLKK